MKKRKRKDIELRYVIRCLFISFFLKHRKITFHTKKQTKLAQKICEKHIKMFETQKIY